MKGLDGRWALITGAAGDIGRAVALRLVSEGCSVVLADHPSTAARLDEAAGACTREAAPVKVRMAQFDVAQPSQVAAALSELAAAGASPSLLFNNAGIQGEFLPIDQQVAADARRVIEVNVLGAMNVLSAAAKAMIASGQPGSIVNSASMAGVSGAPNMPAYSASKAAVIGLTLATAKDLAPHGIRVNAISPAFIGPGKMWTRQVDAQAAAGSQYYADNRDTVAAQMMAQIPLRRLGSLEDVASCVTFLLSDDSSYLTGVNLEVAGGAR
ncbi:MAG: SDR family NAD(P)-dependent oxidoreductase [Acidimicrobiia bacterium]